MSNIIDDEQGRISDADIWELFTGRREPSCLVVNDSLTVITKISRGEFEIIRDTVAGGPGRVRHYYFLHLMWVRESKFGMPPLHDDDLLPFFTSAFALAYRPCDMQYELRSLLDYGYVQPKDLKLRSGWVKSYPLSIAGRMKAEEWFNDLILKTEPFDDTPYLPENWEQEAIVAQTSSAVSEIVDKQPKTEAEQEVRVATPATMKMLTPDGRMVPSSDFALVKGVSIKTVADWRYKGTKAEDGNSGCDVKGNIWERDKYRSNLVRYFLKHESKEKN